MLFGDAHVEAAGGEAFGKELQPGAVRHGGGHGRDPVILRRLPYQAFGEDFGVGRRVRGRLLLFTGDNVKLGDAVTLVRCVFGRVIALALDRDRMDQNRAVRAGLDGPKNRQELIHVVPVDGADIGKTQLFEERAADGHVFQHVLCPLRAFLERRGEEADGALRGGFQLLKRSPA